MRPAALLTLVVAVGCGGSTPAPSGGTTSATPLLTGDSCGLYLDAPSCSAAGCVFSINTRPCIVGEPCPAGWCFAPGPTQPPTGPTAACACEGSAGDVCVLQLGGPAVQGGSTPDLSCRQACRFLAPPTPEQVCSCVAQGPVERCWPSALVTNLCECDNGAR